MSRRLVEGVRSVLDAVEAGDRARAAEILLDLFGEPGRPPVCGVCGQRAWPGDDRGHVWSAHNPPDEAAA